VKRRLRRRGAFLAPILLVAGAAAAAIVLNFVLLGYASAGSTDSLGRFRPQFGSGAAATHSFERTPAGHASKKPKARRNHAPPASVAPSASSTTTSLASGDDRGRSGAGVETELEPGEADDD